MQKLLLPVFWMIALISAFILSGALTDKSLHFFGIAGEKEQTISFQYPVEIIQIFVTDGKDVAQGDLMLEVKRHDLDNNLTMLEQEIRAYQLQKQETDNSIHSQIAGLNAKKQAMSADMDAQIHALELRLQVNADMLHSISAAKADQHVIGKSSELNDLKRKRHFLLQGVQAEIDHLNEQMHAGNRPIDMQISKLVQRKEELQRQNVGLKVRAQFDARIGSVHYKAGELVSPYLPIISVQSRIPRYIKGYIHESILNDVKVGQEVWVKSIAFNNKAGSLSGIVENLGNRIVEYPERLKKNPLVPAWGREVLVRLDRLNHALLFGEKVQVYLENPEGNLRKFTMINQANALIAHDTGSQSALKIESSHVNIPADKIEASGILWHAQDAKYLLICDEQYRQQTGLYIMGEDGVVSAHISLGTHDENDIDDLESISSDGDYIYILSSLAHNKRDQLKVKRRKLIRFRYHNQRVIDQQSIDLYAVIKTINKQVTNAQLASFLQQSIKEHSLDIEAHFIVNNALYLGFKSPFIRGNKSLIMKINNVNALFSGAIPVAEIWQSLALRDPETGEPMQLSDMILLDEQLFLLSVARTAKLSSVLWRYDPEQGILSHLQKFSGLKAEGIAIQPDKSLLTVVFDAGSKNRSSYMSIPYPVSR